MPRLSELQTPVPGQSKGYLQRAEAAGEESLIVDERSKHSGVTVVEEKLRVLLHASAVRFSFFRSSVTS